MSIRPRRLWIRRLLKVFGLLAFAGCCGYFGVFLIPAISPYPDTQICLSGLRGNVIDYPGAIGEIKWLGSNDLVIRSGADIFSVTRPLASDAWRVLPIKPLLAAHQLIALDGDIVSVLVTTDGSAMIERYDVANYTADQFEPVETLIVPEWRSEINGLTRLGDAHVYAFEERRLGLFAQHWDLYAFDLDDPKPPIRRIHTANYGIIFIADVAPAGDRLLLGNAFQTLIYDLANNEKIPLDERFGVCQLDPTWYRDDRSIIYSAKDRLNVGYQIDILEESEGIWQRRNLLKFRDADVFYPALSDDGTRLAFIKRAASSPTAAQRPVVDTVSVYDFRDQTVSALAEAVDVVDLARSPDGRQLAYFSRPPGREQRTLAILENGAIETIVISD